MATRWERFAASTPLEGRVTFLGERADIPRLVTAFDVATLTSTMGEGFPNVVLEAMAAAVPVVATDAGDTRTILGEEGCTVPPRDVAALVQAWEGLLALPRDERVRLGGRLRARALERHSLDTVAAAYADLYRGLARSAALRPE